LVNAGRIKRIWASSPDCGIQFLSSTDILLADFTLLSLISKRAVRDNPKLTIRQGWTLITRAGTIGRMAFARPDMDGLACSEDVLRVIPDPNAIRPGYLYAFLCGRFGLPLVIGGTYGAIIQHIEPEHIADLPVPIAPEGIQDAVHGLVVEATDLRTKASAELRAVIQEIENSAGLPVLDHWHDGGSPDISIIKAGALGARMDGLFHSNFHQTALGPLLGLPASRRATVRDLTTRVFEPPRFKRIPVDDPRYGVPFFGTAAIMRADPEAEQMIARRTSGIEQLLVAPSTILVPRSGQLQGIIGHAVLPHGDVVGGAVSEHGIRIECRDDETAGYVFACLSSEYGRRQLKARAFGSSIPTLDVTRVGTTLLPLLNPDERRSLGQRAFGVGKARHTAVLKEREARALVEHWIERKGNA
jgi:type I restriction enzyme S subunit